jgi:hypothetical protein
LGFLSDHIPHWLAWTPYPPYLQNPESRLSPWKRMGETFLN